jgi:hypothetical protein
MYNWLRITICLGKPSHTPDRWKKLNDAFGEGWEADFGKGAHESQLEAKWDARLVQVKAWVVRHRRYPGGKTLRRRLCTTGCVESAREAEPYPRSLEEAERCVWGRVGG